jgi:hypothetical protein
MPCNVRGASFSLQTGRIIPNFSFCESQAIVLLWEGLLSHQTRRELKIEVNVALSSAGPQLSSECSVLSATAQTMSVTASQLHTAKTYWGIDVYAHFLCRCWLGVSGHLHAPADLSIGKNSILPIGYETTNKQTNSVALSPLVNFTD